MAFVVEQRRREIGIRLALGAQTSSVFGLIIRDGMWLVSIGLVLGLGGAIAATRLLDSFLYGVEPTDPVTFLAITLLLLAVAFVANYLPARRAARTDPIGVLRSE